MIDPLHAVEEALTKALASENFNYRNGAICNALAAIRAARAAVPADREALARKCAERIAATYYGVAEPKAMEGRLIAIAEVEIAAILRQPASEEVEAMAKRLEERGEVQRIWEANLWAGERSGDTLDFDAAAMLRRLSPAEGWRPIESAPKDRQAPILLANRTHIDIGYGENPDEHFDFEHPPTHWRPLPPPPSSDTPTDRARLTTKSPPPKES